jgi:hypothetical protein
LWRQPQQQSEKTGSAFRQNGQWRDITAHSAFKEGCSIVKISFRMMAMSPVTQACLAMVDHG